MSKARRRLSLAFLLACLFAPAQASAQGAILQGGPFTGGHVPMYTRSGNGGQAAAQDSGPAGGGATGLGLSELLLVKRGTGTPPIANQGTGPLNTSACLYDAPITNAAGYHYLCFDPNAQGGGLIAYGAGGAASNLPLSLNINGTNYQFPFVLSGVVGPGSSTVGHYACWNNTAGTLLSDCTLPRVTLSGPADYYVNCNSGHDSSSGTSAAPWQTLQHAWDWTQANLDLAGNFLNIRVQDSSCSSATYVLSASGLMTGQSNDSHVAIIGNTSIPSNVVLSGDLGAVLVGQNARITVAGFKLTSSTGYGLNVTQQSWANYSSINFGAAGSGHYTASKGGQIFDAGDITISAGAPFHGAVFDTGSVAYETTGTTTCVGAMNFSSEYLFVVGGSFTGHTKTYASCNLVTGRRFSGQSLASIGAQTLAKFPGDVAGILDETSIYNSGDGSDTLSLYPAWSAFVPVVTGAGGAVTTGVTSARVKLDRPNRTYTMTAVLPISANTATGWLNVSMPSTGAPVGAGACSAVWTPGGPSGVLGCQYAAGTSTINLTKYDGTVPTGTGTIQITATWETGPPFP